MSPHSLAHEVRLAADLIRNALRQVNVSTKRTALLDIISRAHGARGWAAVRKQPLPTRFDRNAFLAAACTKVTASGLLPPDVRLLNVNGTIEAIEGHPGRQGAAARALSTFKRALPTLEPETVVARPVPDSLLRASSLGIVGTAGQGQVTWYLEQYLPARRARRRGAEVHVGFEGFGRQLASQGRYQHVPLATLNRNLADAGGLPAGEPHRLAVERVLMHIAREIHGAPVPAEATPYLKMLAHVLVGTPGVALPLSPLGPAGQALTLAVHDFVERHGLLEASGRHLQPDAINHIEIASLEDVPPWLGSLILMRFAGLVNWSGEEDPRTLLSISELRLLNLGTADYAGLRYKFDRVVFSQVPESLLPGRHDGAWPLDTGGRLLLFGSARSECAGVFFENESTRELGEAWLAPRPIGEYVIGGRLVGEQWRVLETEHRS